ncbi:hypothetical protein Mapa_013288 [Marchantia paleacea]|nr:hypothetical protein Mapa_013288 [Marchantia paleacea]
MNTVIPAVAHAAASVKVDVTLRIFTRKSCGKDFADNLSLSFTKTMLHDVQRQHTHIKSYNALHTSEKTIQVCTSL